MSRPPRRRFSDVQKTKAVLSYVQDRVPVSQVCENLGIHPNQYFEWKKQAFSGLPYVFTETLFGRNAVINAELIT
jgi:transposase